MVVLADIPHAWRKLLVDLTFAKNYQLAYVELAGRIARNPVLDWLLPSLLHVKAVALIDHAMKLWIEDKGLVIPNPPYRSDLNGRINYLADNHHIADRAPLHAIRGTRNTLAHDPGGEVNWAEMDLDLSVIHGALVELNIIGPMPKWEAFAERSAASPGAVLGADATFHYVLGIKEGDKKVAEFKWSAHQMREES
jgi:hypothetical protein